MPDNRFTLTVLIIVFGLILVCISNLTVVNAQPILNPDFQKLDLSNSRNYSYPEAGLGIIFPQGWSSLKEDLGSHGILVMLLKNNTSSSGFPLDNSTTIQLVVFNKSQIGDKEMSPLNNTAGCVKSDPTSFNINGMNGTQIIQQCNGLSFPIRSESVYFQTSKYLIMMNLLGSPTGYQQSVDDFFHSLTTLRISNTTDAPFMAASKSMETIPEFGPFAGIVISISVIGLVATSRLFRIYF